MDSDMKKKLDAIDHLLGLDKEETNCIQIRHFMKGADERKQSNISESLEKILKEEGIFGKVDIVSVKSVLERVKI